MAQLTDIKSVNWQMGMGGFGNIAEGLADIKQCIGLIITTSKGSDPLRPEFGTDIYKKIDKPITKVAPEIVSEILTGIQLFEPRVKITRLVYAITGATLTFDMYIQVIANGQSVQVLFDIEKVVSTATADTDGRAFGRGFSFAFS
jgi:phage baseplate assembly protein W